jgi:curved DNA-binding protein CbpA
MSREQAEEQFKAITAAYKTLSDHRKRTDYDQTTGYQHSSFRTRTWDPSKVYSHKTQSASAPKDYTDSELRKFINMEDWKAGHYPDTDMETASNVYGYSSVQRNSYMQSDSPHRRYFERRAQREREKERREREERRERASKESGGSNSSSNKSNDVGSDYVDEEAAREALRMRRETRRNTGSSGSGRNTHSTSTTNNNNSIGRKSNGSNSGSRPTSSQDDGCVIS